MIDLLSMLPWIVATASALIATYVNLQVRLLKKELMGILVTRQDCDAKMEKLGGGVRNVENRVLSLEHVTKRG